MVPILLISYIVICLLVIIYVANFAFSLKAKAKRKQATIEQYKQEIMAKHVVTNLHHISHLVSFDEALCELQAEGKWDSDYLHSMEETVKKVAHTYKGKSFDERAYYLQFVIRYAPYFSDKELFQSLLVFLEKPNIYVSENALNALYMYGDASLIQQAFKKLSEQGRFHHPKLIADGLMTVSGNSEQLANLLWKQCSTYQESIQLGIIRFILQTSSSFQEEFLHFLQSEKGSLDVRLEMIRYFRKYPYEPAYPYLMAMLEKKETVASEYRIVVANALSAYPKSSTIQALKEAMSDPEWYVRVNASQSLIDLNVPEEELIDIVGGDDLFASEMMAYRLMEREGQMHA